MPEAYRQEVKRLADIIGLGADVFKPMNQFSGGMKRKLEIIRSLIHNPKVLFLDEPTIGLDPASRRNLWEYLTTVRHQNGMTIFLTTHYLEEAEQSDMICVINQGKVAAYSTPESFKTQLVEPSYLLIDSADHDGLRAELKRAAFPFEETPKFKISLASQNAHQIIRRIETPLSLVKTHIPTLEDAYLSIVDADHD
jgi:ABC-2 type transport system ATP-binding protein